MLAIFGNPDRPAAEHEIEAFINCFLGLIQCIEDQQTGMLRSDWADALSWSTGWSFYDINMRLLPSGVTERMGRPVRDGSIVGEDGHVLRERITPAGWAICQMACIASAARPRSPV